jgi:hypothetical protein
MNLTGCGSVRQISSIEYVEKQLPPTPVEPCYYRVTWDKCSDKYCLNSEGAKALLKNIELMKGYASELKIILDGAH